MGYITDYKLVASPVTEESYKKIDEVLRTFNGYFECEGVDDGVGEWIDTADTWYDSRKHMLQVSKLFPTVHFILYGEGDNREDVWREHYIGGKYQCNCTSILYAPFLPDKMKDAEFESTPSDTKSAYEAEQLWSVHTMLHNCVRALLGENEANFVLQEDQYLSCLHALTDYLTANGYKVLDIFRKQSEKVVK